MFEQAFSEQQQATKSQRDVMDDAGQFQHDARTLLSQAFSDDPTFQPVKQPGRATYGTDAPETFYRVETVSKNPAEAKPDEKPQDKDHKHSEPREKHRATYGADSKRALDPYYAPQTNASDLRPYQQSPHKPAPAVSPYKQFLEDLHKLLDPNYKRNGYRTGGQF